MIYVCNYSSFFLITITDSNQTEDFHHNSLLFFAGPIFTGLLKFETIFVICICSVGS